MPTLLTTRPYDAALGRPRFPAALEDANPGNPVDSGADGDGFIAFDTPKADGAPVLVLVHSDGAAILAALTADDPAAVEV